MTALHIAGFKRRRAIAHLEATREALEIAQRCLDDADRLVPQPTKCMQRFQDYSDDMKSDIDAMIAGLREEREQAA